MAEITKQALKVDNNTSFPNNNNGAITPSILRAFNTNMIDSMVDEIGYNLDSGSWNQQIDALEQFTASASGLTTGSLLITASAVSNVITFTKGNGSTFNVTVADTTDLSSLNAFTASATISLNNLNLWTSSYQPVITNLQASQSIDSTKFTTIGTQSGSWDNTNLNAYTASNDTKWNTLGALSGSFVTESETGSFARTNASNTFTQANTFTSISASSFISASEFVGNGSKITGITASISMPILDEGIPQGNAFSLNFTGSGISAIVVGGTAVISVNTPDSGTINNLTASFNTYTSSTDAKFLAVQASTASLNSFTASFNSNTFVGTASFNSYTQSNDQRVSSLETNSASVNTSISALNTFTASQSTASLVTSITNLNTFTSSQLTINTAIGASTSSLNSATASLFTSASLALVTASFDNGTRNLTFTKGNTTQFSVNIPDASGSAATTIYDTVYTGESITKGDPLYISGSQGANPIVFKADAAVPAKMPVTYVSNQTIGAGTTTEAIILGHIEGVDLTGYTAGQSIYVAEGGGFSTSLPSGSNSITQLLGVVTKGGSGGKGLVLNPGPAQLPGLDSGYMWAGNSNNQPIEITTASFASSASFNSYTSSNDQKVDSLIAATGSYATTGSNSFNGNQIITGSLLISSSAATDLIVTGAMGITGNVISSGSNGQSSLGNIALTITSNAQSSSAVYGRNIMRQNSGSNAMGMAANPNQGNWVVGVTDPSIITYSGSFSSGNYYAPIRFQSGDQYTDGRVTFITPLSASAGFTASLQDGYAWVGNSLGQNTQVATSSFGGGSTINTGSFVTTSSFNEYTSSNDSKVNSLIAATGSYATTGSNSFIGNQTITGSLILSSSAAIELQVIGNSVFTGSAFGNVVSMSITSNTASMNLNTGNYFTLSIPTGTTRLSPSNIQAGTSATLVITTASGSLVTFDSSVKQPSGSAYVPTSGSTDILSFVSVNSSSLFVVATKNMI